MSIAGSRTSSLVALSSTGSVLFSTDGRSRWRMSQQKAEAWTCLEQRVSPLEDRLRELGEGARARDCAVPRSRAARRQR